MVYETCALLLVYLLCNLAKVTDFTPSFYFQKKKDLETRLELYLRMHFFLSTQRSKSRFQ